jgi:peptide/nickel transport system permease protein
LSMTLIAVFISSSIGIFLGVLSGYCGGLTDYVVRWVIDILLAFPNMILALGIAGLLGPSLQNVLISVILVNWVSYAKLSRSIIHSVKSKSYIKIARLCGAGHFQVITKHMLKELVPFVSVMMSMDIGMMILRIAGLSFLGLGATALQPEWGMMIQEARGYMSVAPWLLIFPSGAIILTTICANLMGDGLREWNDPRRWL